MPWATLDVDEQRKQFVIRANSGVECFARLCVSFQISRTTGYHWLHRYQKTLDLGDVKERDRHPHRSPQKTSAEIESRVLELRDRFGWGSKRVANRLKVENVGIASSTVHRIMRCAGRVGHRNTSSPTWMISLLVADNPLALLEAEFHNVPELSILARFIRNGRPRERKKAVVVIASWKKVTNRIVATCLQIPRATAIRYVRIFNRGGTALLFPRRTRQCVDTPEEKNAVFSLLHSPPSLYSINRTSWKMEDLQRVLNLRGHRISCGRIRRIINTSGFRWRKAKAVLTSSDPAYDSKLNAIKQILSKLQNDEAFFSIDEFGPFAVKHRAGRKLVGPGEPYVVPQHQKSSGWLIITAALELSRNQATHFYSLNKNTDEMIKMAELLRTEYRACRTVYLSWDAASWHVSKRLFSRIESLNQFAARDGCPIITTAPLPAGSQFLNVIESVFSGMARAIIHNSNYDCVERAMLAIDRYFAERNLHFLASPKRAGQKIWGLERVSSQFFEGNNCKDPRY